MEKLLSWLSASSAAALAIGALYIIIVPYMFAAIDWRIVTLLVVLVIATGRWCVWGRPTKSILFPAIVGICILPPMLVAAGFHKFDLFAVIHHIQFGMMDADFGIVLRSLAPLIATIILFVLALYWIKNVLGLGDRIYWYGAVVIATVNQLSLSLFEIATTPRYDSDLSEKVRAPDLVAPDTQPDVVIVYLEGLDRSFADRTQFGDIYAPLEALRPEGIDFTAVGQISGTSWSLGGMVATQCGLPLLPNGLRNLYKFETQTAFLSDHTCLSDVLAEQGYRNVHVVGGSIGFGGQDHFLNTHQYQTIIDKSTMRAQFDPETIRRATAARVLDDQMVFGVALETYRNLVADPDPFAMVVVTIGPHGNSGSLARNCTADNQSVETGDIRATTDCTIKNMMTFLDGFRAERGTRPTLLVVVSDHLNHAWTKGHGSGSAGRNNTVMMIGLDMPDVPKGVVNDRPAAMIDVYPTILSLLGMAPNDTQGGLGVSLVGTAPTLTEQKGIIRLNQELQRNYDLSRVIWGGQ